MGKGGSRYGAGRPGHRGKAEHLQRVEIGRWHRGGYLREGTRFTWSWNRGGEPIGSIGVQMCGPDSLRLQYSIVGDDDQRCHASQTICIDRTSCHYGGARPSFRCPVSALDRMWRKQAKIEARLGDNCATAAPLFGADAIERIAKGYD